MNQLRRVWRILSMRCDESVALLSQSQDESLSRLDRLALKSHLLFCKPCRRIARQFRFLRTALAATTARADDSGQCLSAAARLRIQQAISQASDQ
jgi:hypothetical protein